MSSKLQTDDWSWAPRRTGSRDLHGWVSKSTAKKPLSGNRAPCLDRAFKSPHLTVSGAFVRLSEIGRGFIVCVVSVSATRWSKMTAKNNSSYHYYWTTTTTKNNNNRKLDRSDSTLDFNSGGVSFEYQLGHRPSQPFFFQSLQASKGTVT